MKKLVILLMISVAAIAVLNAQQAQFAEINGKVEYQTASGDWRPARIGDKIGLDVVVSTGFKSGAVIKVGQTSITMRPLTRLSLEQLMETDAGSQTQLYLIAGRVKADVPPQQGKTTEFTVRSTTATASVRGTGFEFDGRNLIVERGAVQLGTSRGHTRRVSKGEFSFVSKSGAVSTPVTVAQDKGLEVLDQIMEQVVVEVGDPAGVPDVAPSLPTTATITVNLQ